MFAGRRVALWALIAVLAAPALALATFWTSDPYFTPSSIVISGGPANYSVLAVGAGPYYLSCQTVTDKDTEWWDECDWKGEYDDPVTITWTTDGTSTVQGSGTSRTWTLPSAPGTYSVEVKADDAGTGDRDDGVMTDKITVYVVGIDHMEYYKSGEWRPVPTPFDLYVVKNTKIDFRVIRDGSSWPSGCPVWTGATEDEEDSSYASTTFDTLSSEPAGRCGVTVGCGTDSASVEVCVWTVNFDEPETFPVFLHPNGSCGLLGRTIPCVGPPDSQADWDWTQLSGPGTLTLPSSRSGFLYNDDALGVYGIRVWDTAKMDVNYSDTYTQTHDTESSEQIVCLDLKEIEVDEEDQLSRYLVGGFDLGTHSGGTLTYVGPDAQIHYTNGDEPLWYRATQIYQGLGESLVAEGEWPSFQYEVPDSQDGWFYLWLNESATLQTFDLYWDPD